MVIVFGCYWISNFDLFFWVKEKVLLVKYDWLIFYNVKSSKGYIDWVFSEEFVVFDVVVRVV